MKNLLSNIFVDTILPITILILAIIIAILIYRRLQKKFNKPFDSTPKGSDNPKVKVKNSYCTEDEMKFLQALHKSLPRDCISFPHVGVSKLVEPNGDLVDYKMIQDKFVDICVFLRKDMSPILVIDLYSPVPTQQQLKKLDKNITNVLKVAKIPIISQEIKNKYDSDEILTKVLNNVDSKIVAYLKNKQ